MTDERDRPPWSYRAGEWYAVLGAGVAVFLPATERVRAARLWALVDEGAGFEEALDALLADGVSGLPGFVVLGREGDRTRILVRGPARVRAGAGEDVVVLQHGGGTVWVERVLEGVDRVQVSTPPAAGAHAAGAGEGSELVVRDGLVRLSAAEWPAVASPASEPAPVEPAPHEPLETQPVATMLGSDADDVTDTIGTGDHDGLTGIGQVDPAALSRPGIPGQPPAPDVTARPVARLLFSSGEVVDVDRPVLVGRAPVAEPAYPPGLARVVPVPSPRQEISSTHAEIRPGSGADHGTAVVTDLGSTNGTLLTQPGLPAEELRAGVPVQLLPGAVVDLGDGLTIRVATP